MDGTGREDQKRGEEWMPACRNCGLPIRESQQPQARFGWTHTGDWEGVRCPGRVTGAVPDVRAAYRAGREDAARALAGLPIEAVRALCVLWDTWWNKVDTYDAAGMAGIASLIGAEGGAAMEEACDAVEPYEPEIVAFLARRPGVQPTEEQRAREEDQERDEEEFASPMVGHVTRSDIESVAYATGGGFLSREVNFEFEEDEEPS